MEAAVDDLAILALIAVWFVLFLAYLAACRRLVP